MTRDLVVVSLEPWDEMWRRNQHLISGLLRRDPGLRVLFVEPPVDPLHELRSGRPMTRAKGLRPGPDPSGRLILLEPVKWLPRAVGPSADRLLVRSVRRAVTKLGWTTPTLWINDPRWAHLSIATGWPTLYDITDDWLAADRDAREHARLVNGERVLMDHSREVVVCSHVLADQKGAVRPVTLVPNAVDVERYRVVADRPTDLPDAPVGVYVGTLHEDRLDVDLVARAAQRLRDTDARVVFVGPNALSADNTSRLEREKNVVLLGGKPHMSIPAYMQHADVLLVPHAVTSFTETLDPIKLYEYQAVGRPILSTPVARFRDLDGAPGMTVVEPEVFPDALRAALLAPDRTIRHVDVPDWADRVEEMAAVLSRM